MIFPKTSILTFLIIGLSLYLLSCSKPLEPTQYIQWIEDPENGLLQRIEREGVTYGLQYTPSEYLVLQSSENENLSVESVEEGKKNYESHLHFTLRIRPEKGKAMSLPATSLNSGEPTDEAAYLLSGFTEDIYIKAGSDSLPCLMSHLEQSFGASPDYTFQLMFPKPRDFPREDLVIVFNDRLFKGETITFDFPSSSIKSTPTLAL